MTEEVYRISDGSRVGSRDVVKDMLGRDWELAFGARPGIRGQPEGEFHVRKPGKLGMNDMRAFAPHFFPDLTFDRPGIPLDV